MHALVTQYGSSQLEAIDRCISIQEQHPPSISEVPDGAVVVAVRACEVVWTDTVMLTGQYQHQARLPYSPGMTYAGIVAFASPQAIAQGVRVGDRVAIAGADAGPRSSGRFQRYGGCASWAIAPTSAIRWFPQTWTFPQACCFAYGYDTAYHALVECGEVRAGETILINGASGGVGIPAVRMCVMLGLTVISMTRSADKIDFLKSIGVHHVIELKQSGSLHEQVRAFTKGNKGVDVVYDGVGGDQITIESMRALRFGGRLLVVGWAATPNVAAGKGDRAKPSNPNRIPTNLVMMKGLRVIGCPAMIAATHDPQLIPRRVKAVTKWLEEEKLPPPIIASAFPLADLKEALKCKVNSGSVVGSVVVCPPASDYVYTAAKL